jgi:hypothetical protein
MQVVAKIIKILQKTVAPGRLPFLPHCHNNAFGVLRESARDSLEAPFDVLINKIKAIKCIYPSS